MISLWILSTPHDDCLNHTLCVCCCVFTAVCLSDVHIVSFYNNHAIEHIILYSRVLYNCLFNCPSLSSVCLHVEHDIFSLSYLHTSYLLFQTLPAFTTGLVEKSETQMLPNISNGVISDMYLQLCVCYLLW